jgi:hypothetical protein
LEIIWEQPHLSETASSTRAYLSEAAGHVVHHVQSSR